MNETKTYGKLNIIQKIYKALTVRKVWYKVYIPIKDDWNGEY